MGKDGVRISYSGDPNARRTPQDENLYYALLELAREQDGSPYAHRDYVVKLDNGKEIRGMTDWKGHTSLITTKRPQSITQLNILVPAYLAHERKYEWLARNDVQVTDVTRKPGDHVIKVTIPGESRPLSFGEIEMASLIFKDSIDYSLKKIHKKKYIMFQDDRTGMAPNGNMYIPRDIFKEDFSKDKDDKIWFMHEMTHVWQFTLGYNLKWAGLIILINGGYTGQKNFYKYDKNNINSKFSDYNMEAQAELISHYYAAKYMNHEDYLPSISFYEKTLEGFLKDPSNPSHLPSN
jgi:type VI secretion system secreted protein VgrG